MNWIRINKPFMVPAGNEDDFWRDCKIGMLLKIKRNKKIYYTLIGDCDIAGNELGEESLIFNEDVVLEYCQVIDTDSFVDEEEVS